MPTAIPTVARDIRGEIFFALSNPDFMIVASITVAGFLATLTLALLYPNGGVRVDCSKRMSEASSTNPNGRAIKQGAACL
jgi:hypothetical protein